MARGGERESAVCLARLADFAYRRRGTVVLPWIVSAVVIIGLGSSLAGEYHADYNTPGSESKAASELTKRVITAAAAIMVVVFLAFVTSPEVFLELFGIGLASAIFLDATLVRMVLVPAVMQLLGARNWWIPDWLSGSSPGSWSRPPSRRWPSSRTCECRVGYPCGN